MNRNRPRRTSSGRRALAPVTVQRHTFALPTPYVASSLQVVDMGVLGGWVEAFWMDANGKAFALAKFGHA